MRRLWWIALLAGAIVSLILAKPAAAHRRRGCERVVVSVVVVDSRLTSVSVGYVCPAPVYSGGYYPPIVTSTYFPPITSCPYPRY